MRAVANESVDIQLLELDLDKTPYTVTKSYQSSFYKRVTFKMLDKEKRRRLTNCGVYFAVLMLGVLIGLIPFLIQYVKETQADREVLRQFVHQNITEAWRELAELQKKVSEYTKEKKPSAFAITSRTTRTVVRRRASSVGNASITLQCKGMMKIEKVSLNNVTPFPDTIRKFDKYCKEHEVIDKNMKKCTVSMQLVLKIKLDTFEFTEVEYSCEETVKK
eukprot:gene16020-7363_t